MKIFLKRPALYHFQNVVLVPGENEITPEFYELLLKNKIVKLDFDAGILEVENSEIEKPKIEKKTKKKKPKKVQREIEAELVGDDSRE